MWKRVISVCKRWIAPGSLRSQLLSRSLFILAIILLLLGVVQYMVTKDFLYRSNAEAMMTQMRSLPRSLYLDHERSEHGELNNMNNNLSGDNSTDNAEATPLPRDERKPGLPFLFLPDTSLALIKADGSFTNLSGDYGMIPPQLSNEAYEQLIAQLTSEIQAPNQSQTQSKYEIMKSEDGTEQLVVFMAAGPPGSQSGILQMGTKTSTLQSLLMNQLLLFLLLSLLALAAGLALYLPLLRRTLAPLSRVVTAVEQTDAGNLSERLPTAQGQQEIDQLADSFNGMLERLSASFEAEREAKERMRRFVADASHELRTPLTSIHGFLEVLLRGAAAKPEQLEVALKSMHGESTRLNKLVADLLLLAKLDQKAEHQLHLHARLDEVLRDMQPQLEMLAGSRRLELKLAANAGTLVDADKMKQVVLNLVHNAIQHTDAVLGVIHLTLKRIDNAQIELCVQDNGAGIAPEHIASVFDRFYRSDSSRTRKYGGAGLGLSITRSIVEAHGGTIKVESELGIGTLFRIRMPMKMTIDKLSADVKENKGI